MTQPDPALTALLATIPFAACPMPDVVTAGQPHADAFAGFAAAGCKTVVDLRAPQEPRGYNEEEAVRQAGLEYIRIPVTGATLTDETFDRFRTLMRDASRRPIVVHCASSNRVGALLLPYFILDEKMDRDDAIALAMRAGLRAPDLADLALAYADDRA